MSKVCVVIPLYKDTLSASEEQSIIQGLDILDKHKKVFITADNYTLPDLLRNYSQLTFDKNYFRDITGYNRLMLSREFYQKFSNYGFILIYQPDAWVFRDELLDWCNKNYDYIGAPWVKKKEIIFY